MDMTKIELDHRLTKLRIKLVEQNLDALILTEEESIYYLTGMTYKSLERLFILIVLRDRTVFIIPRMEYAHLKASLVCGEISVYEEYPAEEGKDWKHQLYACISDQQGIALEKKSPFEIYDFLNKKQLEVQSSTVLDELRYVKSATEIEKIRVASDYCDRALLQLEKSCYYGMSELEVFSISNHIQRQIIRETSFDYLATDVLMAAWPSRISHQPHGIPHVADRLVAGSHISLAFMRVNGYAAELERTFFTSKPTKEQAGAFAIMMGARSLTYNMLRPGVSCHDIDHSVRVYFEQHGMKEHIMHRTGHGIGIGNHEGPFIAMGDYTILQENMVISVEPGIYIAGVGGFRHSDTVLITDSGYEILTHAPEEMDALVFDKKRLVSMLKGAIIRRLYKV